MSSLVVMFCGPHRGAEWSPLYHRVEHAVCVAHQAGAPVVIAGDCFGGRAVAHFAEFARARGVARALEAYDPGGYTEADARAVAALLRASSGLDPVDRLLVVTDDWHAERCRVMLLGEARKLMPGRRFDLVDASTAAGPRPPPERVLDERFGIEDYLAGRPRRPRGTPFGKPAHPGQEPRLDLA